MSYDHNNNPSRHKCLIYEGAPSNQLPVIVPLLKDVLQQNWRCLYLGSPEMVSMVDIALQLQGVDTIAAIKNQSLILSSDRSHLHNGDFNAREMVDSISDTVDAATKDGFTGLFATGDMRWELGDDKNFKQLLEYEQLLEGLFQRKALMGVCQYHRDILPKSAIQDALLAHKTIYLDAATEQTNTFYLPSEANNQQTDWLSSQIIRVLKAERSRDIALQELSLLNLDLEKRVQLRTAELQVANEQMETFSYSISHDLRTPLRSIHSFSSILDEEATELTSENREHLQRIIKNADYMEKLIDGLLKISRAVSSKMKIDTIDMSGVSEEIVKECRINDTNRVVDVQIQTGMTASGDATLIRSVLENLISNAWKFTGKTEHASISIGQDGSKSGKPIFYVKDNGAGFDDKSMVLFSPFQRLHSSEEYAGNGIGLATVSRIITRHGGEIWAESSVGNGATFFFTLPIS